MIKQLTKSQQETLLDIQDQADYIYNYTETQHNESAIVEQLSRLTSLLIDVFQCKGPDKGV